MIFGLCEAMNSSLASLVCPRKRQACQHNTNPVNAPTTASQNVKMVVASSAVIPHMNGVLSQQLSCALAVSVSVFGTSTSLIILLSEFTGILGGAGVLSLADGLSLFVACRCGLVAFCALLGTGLSDHAFTAINNRANANSLFTI